MATTNNITGDTIKSRPASNLYRDNYEAIFGKKEKERGREEQPKEPEQPSNGRRE